MPAAEYEPSHPFVWPDDPRVEEGELLWEERTDSDSLGQLKRALGSYGAAGQLQQRPAPAEGEILKQVVAVVVGRGAGRLPHPPPGGSGANGFPSPCRLPSRRFSASVLSVSTKAGQLPLTPQGMRVRPGCPNARGSGGGHRRVVREAAGGTALPVGPAGFLDELLGLTVCSHLGERRG